MRMLLELEQGSPEWHLVRSGLPTASCADQIVTAGGKASASADKYIGELIDEIVRPMDERDEDEQRAQFSGNRHTERGHTREPKARNWFRFVTGLDVRTVGFVLNDDGTAGCSPDSLVFAGDEPIEGVEIKAPEGKKHVFWMLQGGLPDEHKQQVHASMAITGLSRWWFVSYCPGYKPFKVLVERDAYTETVATLLAGFTARLADAKAQFIDYLPEQKAA